MNTKQDVEQKIERSILWILVGILWMVINFVALRHVINIDESTFWTKVIPAGMGLSIGAVLIDRNTGIRKK